jgi:two-component system chemotaxis response regulator CheY
MDGIEATHSIVSSYPDARIVMITSMAEKPMMLDALDAGARSYILKPFDADRLRRVIDTVVDP